ncbi:melanoma-associated antigen 10 [Rousettus aegyptiacus]|uniref:melanoma-associated antigen 10 n=1 Tax=Rousettus aegyptiacus TaxID=9407 RepID=UPI00168CC906|nr:melanoma-associated antigen 10 [Rousettus aegyptiacus]
MPLTQMNELSKHGEDRLVPIENQNLFEELLIVSEEENNTVSPASSISSTPSVLFPDSPDEMPDVMTPTSPHSPQGASPLPAAIEATSLSPSEEEGPSNQVGEGPSTVQDLEIPESSLREALRWKVFDLVRFLLLKYRAREPTTKSEMLSRIIKEHEDHFPEIFSRASQCLRLLFGIEVKEVDPRDGVYFLVTTGGFTYDAMVGEGFVVPNTGLLVMLLCVILVEGDCAPEEDVWKALNGMGVHDGREHCIYGEPRELITSVWVREQYVEYRQVPNSDPAHYELLWGPRAHTEITKFNFLEYLLRVNSKDLSFFLNLSKETESDEEERS